MTRPRRARARAPEMSDLAWCLLTDEPLPPIEPGSAPAWELHFLRQTFMASSTGQLTLRGLWGVHGEEIAREWADAFPGTRPSCWWLWTAPEPRQRVGGIGTPAHEALCVAQAYRRGIPTLWITQWDVDFYNGRLADIHGRPIGTIPDRPFVAFPPSPSNPPRYEAQATFLERHRLLLPGERVRIDPEAFRPELVAVGEGEG